VDEGRFPRFPRALEKARVAELEPGDALYLPGMWWHHVEALDEVNLLINYWWRDSELYLGSPQMALLHAALAIGQLGEAERAPWEALFRDLVFRRSDEDWAHIDDDARGVLGKCDATRAAALQRLLAQQLKV
jgi:hypothetical protein